MRDSVMFQKKKVDIWMKFLSLAIAILSHIFLFLRPYLTIAVKFKNLLACVFYPKDFLSDLKKGSTDIFRTISIRLTYRHKVLQKLNSEVLMYFPNLNNGIIAYKIGALIIVDLTLKSRFIKKLYKNLIRGSKQILEIN